MPALTSAVLAVKKSGEAGPKAVWQHYEPVDGDLFVVISQSCDIHKALKAEPYVLAIRAFRTAEKGLLHIADRNSARFFLLDRATGMVADCATVVVLDKRLLADQRPAHALANDPERRNVFARWLARRFTRTAFEDPIQEAVIGPIQSAIHKCDERDEKIAAALKWVNEFRIRHLEPADSYEVRLLLVCDEDVPGEEQLALARLAVEIKKALPEKAALISWDIASLREISYADVIETDEIMLDDLSFMRSA